MHGLKTLVAAVAASLTLGACASAGGTATPMAMNFEEGPSTVARTEAHSADAPAWSHTESASSSHGTAAAWSPCIKATHAAMNSALARVRVGSGAAASARSS